MRRFANRDRPVPFESQTRQQRGDAMNRYRVLSLTASLAALVVSGGALAGLWASTAAPLALTLGGATLALLLINSGLILRRVYQATSPMVCRQIAWLCLLSMGLCIAGDVVNFNIRQTYYRHGSVIRHDYLADSVLFFGPGYLLLLVAVLKAVRFSGTVGYAGMWACLGVSLAAGAVSFLSLYLPGTGAYVGITTGLYSMLITAVGGSGVLLLVCYGAFRAPAGIRAVSLGLVLATAADAVIGAFWLYGNGGEGFFPIARDVNWVLYIASQSLVIQLPLVMIRYGQAREGDRGR